MSFGSGNEISKLKQFIVDNNIVGTSAGVCIALATKDGIQSLVGDIIIPSIVILLHTNGYKWKKSSLKSNMYCQSLICSNMARIMEWAKNNNLDIQ